MELGDLVGIYIMHNFISTLPSMTDHLCTTDEHQQVLTTGAPTISNCSKDYNDECTCSSSMYECVWYRNFYLIEDFQTPSGSAPEDDIAISY